MLGVEPATTPLFDEPLAAPAAPAPAQAPARARAGAGAVQGEDTARSVRSPRARQPEALPFDDAGNIDTGRLVTNRVYRVTMSDGSVELLRWTGVDFDRVR